jgi:hypothetical protein
MQQQRSIINKESHMLQVLKIGFTAQVLTVLALIVAANVNAQSLDAFRASEVVVGRKLNESELTALLAKGKTCIKDGVKTLFHSKDITKRHCQKAAITGVNVIKISEIENKLAQKILGF